jgi:transposase, IS5 family
VLPDHNIRGRAELADRDGPLTREFRDRQHFAPFAPQFLPVLGRSSIPVECYLRLMFLKFRYRLGL